MQGEWQTLSVTGTDSDEVDLGMECTGLLVLLGNVAGATWTIKVSNTSGGTFYTLDKPNAGGALAIPESKASFIDCLGGAQYIKLISASAETAAAVYVKGVK